MPSPLLPPRLRRGNLIGVIAPAGPVTDDSRIERAVRYCERLGYRVVVGSHATRVQGYLAGTDAERLADFHAMIAHPDVRAVIALRGGYGSSRLLPFLNYRLIARHPKIIVGHSDLTALQLAIWRKCRLVTFHGPMFAVDFAGHVDPFTEEHFWRLVTSPAVPVRLTGARSGATDDVPAVTGRLLGGNLSLIVSLLGTPFFPDFRGSLLFVEDVGEEPYRIDRMFAHLRNASILRQVNGIAGGRFAGCMPADRSRPSQSVRSVLREAAQGLPLLEGLPFGHIRRKVTLPLGVLAALDPRHATLDLLEPAVR